jgi:hypothetical protein
MVVVHLPRGLGQAFPRGVAHIVVEDEDAAGAQLVAPTRCRKLSSPMAVTRTSNAPAPLTEPPTTGSPSAFSTGTGSPVTKDWSTPE